MNEQLKDLERAMVDSNLIVDAEARNAARFNAIVSVLRKIIPLLPEPNVSRPRIVWTCRCGETSADTGEVKYARCPKCGDVHYPPYVLEWIKRQRR